MGSLVLGSVIVRINYTTDLLGVCVICTSNSMGSSEIWDKYHECCIGNGDKFHEMKPSGIYHFQYNKSGIYPKFHCYPCYSQLIPYSLYIRMLCISIAMYAICHYVLTRSTLIGATLLT